VERSFSRDILELEKVAVSVVTIIGAGLAGSEAALQLAARGHRVRLIEQKPKERTQAQITDHFCELVCSNSFRGAALGNAVGLLKQEMRLLGSYVIQAADAARVPAGGALAVDRERFSELMTARLASTPGIEVVAERVDAIPSARPVLLATGPLTADALARDIAAHVGGEHLAYYDAIAPIVSADSIDWDQVFMASRWDKGATPEDQRAYVNCPLDRAGYEHFVAELLGAQKVQPKSFEEVRYFEGCLPIEVMAERGPRTLAFGPMKPVGLTDPRTGRWPHAVVQLRSEDEAQTAYNMVGFQTRLTWGEQARIFRQLPGLANAEFVRYGAIHRNTFLNAPRLLGPSMALKNDPGVYFAGQITGSEGYVEGSASGWLAAWFIARELEGKPASAPPVISAHGGLMTHLSRNADDYQPSNITFSHLPPWDGPRMPKRNKHEAMAARGLNALYDWMLENGLEPRLDRQSLLSVPGLEAPVPPAAPEVAVVVDTSCAAAASEAATP
jgi:methylenetetrahydrofolate--tRNA-(uracil-5-)-methyltransferase